MARICGHAEDKHDASSEDLGSVPPPSGRLVGWSAPHVPSPRACVVGRRVFSWGEREAAGSVGRFWWNGRWASGADGRVGGSRHASEGGREGGRRGGRERGREEGREGGREGGREEGRKEGREGGSARRAVGSRGPSFPHFKEADSVRPSRACTREAVEF